VIETRGRHPLLPLRLLADRNRTGANLAMLCTGAALFGMFFFLTLFLQLVWGYSAVKAGLAYLPMTAAIGVTSGAAAQLLPRIGARPTIAAGTVAFGSGLYWLSQLSVHGTYLHTILGPTLVAGAGLGLLFVPLTVVAMAKVPHTESGVAASLRNTAQQVGGSIGLAVLATVAFTTAASSARADAARAAAAARAGHTGWQARPSHAALAGIYHHALATGFARGFLIAAAIMLLALITTVATIRIRRADLAGVNPI
jgi:Major Facilitator Superfamily